MPVDGPSRRPSGAGAALWLVMLAGLLVLVIGAGGAMDPLALRPQGPGQASATIRPSPASPDASRPGPAAADAAPPARRFGMVAHLMWNGDTGAAVHDLDVMRAAGLGLVRFDVSWRHLEPAPGEPAHLDALDAVMAAIAERGMRPVVTVIETPDWANGGRGAWTPPDDAETYARFVAMLAGRYATRVDAAWEVWNEPNDPRFWQPAPDPSAYAALLVAASAAIHAADPGATVLGGSILYGDTAFLEGMYAAGARGSFDGLAIHPYAEVRAPWDTGDRYHSFLGTIDGLRAVMVAHGDGGKGLWLTEVGWALGPGVDEPTRADYLAQAVTMVADRPDIEAMAVYVFDAADDQAFGLVDDGLGDAGFSAYAEAVRRLAPGPAAP